MKSSSRNEKMLSNRQADLIADIKQILHHARTQVHNAVNSSMVQAYWLIGKRIVEEEQGGINRAEYGKNLITTIAKALSAEFNKGFDAREVRKIRQFYLFFPIRDSVSTILNIEDNSIIKWDSLSPESDKALYKLLFTRLSWTHIRHLLRVSDPEAREWYIKETATNNWATRTLERNISTHYYQRILSSQVKQPVIEEMQKKTAMFQKDNLDFIKNPSVLEFLNLPANMGYTEKKLEQALINNLQQFLLELGKGYAFVERQQLVRTEISDFYIDLVFYNYILKCFVIIELKTEKMTHQDIGQLDMYVRMYDDLKRNKGDNPTVGILLCTETDKTIAKYSVLNENKQLFATKYLPYLPSEEELATEIEREKELIRLQMDEEGRVWPDE